MARFDAVALTTPRFLLQPVRPLGFARATLPWTEQRDAFANLGWRRSRWTLWRWWQHLRRYSRRGRILHGIWPRSGGPCIGLHIIEVSAPSLTASLSVFIADPAWRGRGVVPELRQAIFADCFGRMGLQRVWTQVHARNAAAVRNQQKLGLVHEGTLRSTGLGADGQRTDTMIFGLLRAEWLARQKHMEISV